MRYRDNIEWLKSLKHQIGQSQHRDLWHFEQVIDETIENLKPLAKPHGRLIDADDLDSITVVSYPNTGDPFVAGRLKKIIAPTIIEAEVSE